MSKAKIAKRICEFEKNWEREVYEIIAEIREQVVIPFCNKNGLYFSAGMGEWSFDILDEQRLIKADVVSGYLKREGDGLINPLTGRTMRGSKSVCQWLNLSIAGLDNGYGIGSLMESYTPESQSIERSNTTAPRTPSARTAGM